ncbi:MAG: M50 family metallopeptidase [Anaerolineae bacterium]|nr:M50 family metallopeptidase [Anaerolineae bacterium]
MSISPNLVSILQFITALATLIFIHELGHFVAAKVMKIEVEEFGIGFPPRMIRLFTAGGTIFSLNWIPLGGFVRPKGENNPEIAGGLAAANPWARIFVLIAGPAVNLLAGAVLFGFIYLQIGGPVKDEVVVLYIAPGSPAEQAGLAVDDVFVSIDNQTWDDIDEFQDIVKEYLGKSVVLKLLRGENEYEVELVPRSSHPTTEGPIGIGIGNPLAKVDAGQAFVLGGEMVASQIRMLIELPANFRSGQVSSDEMRVVGYKGLFDIYADLSESDKKSSNQNSGINVLGFFASISVSLGLFNLLPIPALDGGRILFAIPEILFRKRVPTNFENVLHLLFFAVLILFLIYVNVQDFVNPVVLP